MTTLGKLSYHAQGVLYKDGSTYYAHNTTDLSQTTGTSASTVLNTLIDNLYNAYGVADILITGGIIDFESTSLNLGARSNIRLRGEGRDITKILNGAIINTGTSTTNNIQLEDMTIDANNNRGNCVNLQKVTDMKVKNVKMQNSSTNFLFNWTNSDGLIVEDSQFIDGGLTTAADNCAGSQIKTTENVSTWRNCFFKKTPASQGSAMLTTGATGNLLVDGCISIDTGSVTTSYAFLSIESAFGTCKDITVKGCHAYGDAQTIQIGNSSTNAIDRAIISNCTTTGFQKIQNASEGLIENSIIHNSSYGFYVANNKVIKVNNCFAKNTNKNNSTGSSDDDKGGLFGLDNDYLEINNFTALEDNSAGFMPHGIRCGNTTLTDNQVHITNPILIGPFRDWALRVSNSIAAKVTGGTLYSGATTSFSGNTTLEIRDLRHYNPVGLSAIAVGASPHPYTAGTSPETIYVYGGTVSSITKAGTQIANQTGLSVEMEPNTAIIVTYSSVPTMVKNIH